MHSRHLSQGFTLIELAITLLLVGLLAGLASNSWTSLISSTRHASTINETHRIFAFARSYAVNKRVLTTICPLSNAMTCTDDWSKPVSVFPDEDNDKRPDGGEIHRITDLAKDQLDIYSRTAGRGYFQFAPNGMSHGTMGSLIVCSRSEEEPVEISYLAVSIGGRLRHLRDEDHDGVIRLPWGVSLTCP
ncbi:MULTISPECIES: GspH/FimT family pseudopilin [unclassified Marinobacter]|uniref:GspH/FimT family pseudopilin n=1 Tax=unclassified Marinobacter TaxID=83889 RepID=UPI0019070BE5|nr:GspH/FimT family protein [Marinobacter sp. 1-4A]MBK1852828.1 GspH/FimT family pseudopilin [Marinobacter sp. 1-4A]